jgi:hypothetical protein
LFRRLGTGDTIPHALGNAFENVEESYIMAANELERIRQVVEEVYE